jgi:hypothetical protein
MRRFLAIVEQLQPGFSATQTEWRSAQSCANPSLRKFPANREKYREFLHFWIEKTTLQLVRCSCRWSYRLRGLKTNREFSEAIRENTFPVQECIRGEMGL